MANKELMSLANRWINARGPASADFSVAGLSGFVNTLEHFTNEFITEIGATHEDIYEALSELAQNASAVLRQRKVYINGVDRTPPR